MTGLLRALCFLVTGHRYRILVPDGRECLRCGDRINRIGERL